MTPPHSFDRIRYRRPSETFLPTPTTTHPPETKRHAGATHPSCRCATPHHPTTPPRPPTPAPGALWCRTHPLTASCTSTHTHTQVSLSILTARGGVLGSGLELRQPRPSGLRLDGANDPFETRLVRGSSVEFELGFETGVVLWSNPASLVQVCLFGQKRGAERGATFEGRGVERCTAARNVRGGKTIVSHR